MVLLNHTFCDRSLREPRARFRPGDLVRHRRYHYRGVVVTRDPECQASEEWYQANQSQPPRDQPWYHVLVDNSPSITYPAESSLEPDPDPAPIHHPMINRFFKGFDGGRYLRNGVEWPPQ